MARYLLLFLLLPTLAYGDVYKFNPYTGKLDNIGNPGTNIGDNLSNMVSGSQTISCGFILSEDGGFELNQDGTTKELLECATIDHILSENVGFELNEDGTKELMEDSGTPGAGTATPLFATSTLSSSAWVTANSGNSATLYVGNSAVSSSNGIPLSVGEPNVYLPTYDLSKVYITGNGGDGVTFIYFGSLPSSLGVTYLGNTVTYLGNSVTYLGI